MSLTPRQFQHLVKRHKREQERQEFLLALINRNVVSFSMCRPKDYTPQITDFMPSRWGRDEDDSDEAALVRLANSIATPEAINKGLVRVQ